MTLRSDHFAYNGATITCRESLGMDDIDDALLYAKLTYNRQSERERNRAIRFVEMVLRTVSIEGDLGYPWCTADSSPADTQKAFEAWQTWPKALLQPWQGLLYLLNQPATEPEFQPDAEPKNVSPPPSTSDGGG